MAGYGSFNVDSLSAAISTYGEDVDKDSITQLFRAGRPIDCVGDSVSWDEVEMHRHLAPITGPDSPSSFQGQATKRVRSSALAHIKVSKMIPGSSLFKERAPGIDGADPASVLGYELEDLQKMIGASIEYLCASALLGTINVSNTTIPGSTVSFSVAFSPNTYTAGTWSSASTKIVSSEIVDLMKDHRAASGMVPKIAITEPDVTGYIMQNTEAQTMLSNAFGAAFLQRSAFDPSLNDGGLQIGGLSFRTSDGVYVPEGGSPTRYWTQDRIALLPALDKLGGVLGMAEGYGIVPDGPAFGGAGSLGLKRAPSRGFYAYTMPSGDPAGIKLVAGWVGLPILLFPSAVTVATVS